jgi:predicted O-methyltransferase YrrM
MEVSRSLHYLRHPDVLIARVRRALYDRRHPGEPWLSPRAIRFLEEQIQPSWVALEWGSGRSTAWFGARVARLTSVEHDDRWFTIVRRRLTAAGLTNVDLRHIPVEHPPHTPPDQITTVPAYVAVADDIADGSLDLAIVDGMYRPLCIMAAMPKLRSGGLLLVDDTTWLPGLEAGPLAAWPVACDGREGVGSTIIWRKP